MDKHNNNNNSKIDKYIYISIGFIILVYICIAIYIYFHDKEIKKKQLEYLNNALFNSEGIPITEITNNLENTTNNIINKYKK